MAGRPPCSENLDIRWGKVEASDHKNDVKIEISQILAAPSTEKYQSGEDYIGIIYYSFGEGQSGTAIMLLRNSKWVADQMKKKNYSTMHQALHAETYGSKRNLVATGFSVQNGKVVGNSTTFNSGQAGWLDQSFYSDDRTVSEDELKILEQIVESFKSHSGNVGQWQFNLRTKFVIVQRNA